MSAELIRRIIVALVFVAVVGVPLFYLRQSVYPFVLPKTLFFQAVVELILVFWLLLVAVDRRYLPKPTPVLVALGGFLAALLIAAFLGADPWRSFWSTHNRAFGVFAVAHLASLAMVLASLKKRFPWKKLFYASIGTALTVDALAVAQLWRGDPLFHTIVGGRPGATFGSSALLAGYLLFSAFLAVYLFLEALKRSEGIQRRLTWTIFFTAAALMANVVVLFLTQTRGDILGLASGALALLLLFAFKPPQGMPKLLSSRKFYAATAAFLVLFGAAFWLTRASGFWNAVPGLGRFQDVSLANDSFLPRLSAAKAAWRGFLDNPLFGVGPENFNLVYDKYYDPAVMRLNYTETYFDKPHNFLLEDLAVGGLTLTLTHLALFVLFVVFAFRTRGALFGQISAALLTGYFVRNLFFFEALGSALPFYLLLGYVSGESAVSEAGGQREMPNSARVLRWRIPGLAATIALIFAGAFLYFVNIRPLGAAASHNLSLLYAENGLLEEARQKFTEVVGIWSPYAWNFARDYAVIVAGTYYSNPENVSREIVFEAVEKLERAAREHPLDSRSHLALVDVYNQISGIAPEKFLGAAEREAEIALKLSPKRQQIFFSLAKTKALRGDFNAAAELARKAVTLDDGVAESHFYYGLFSFLNGDRATAYIEIKKSIALGKSNLEGVRPVLDDLGIAY